VKVLTEWIWSDLETTVILFCQGVGYYDEWGGIGILYIHTYIHTYKHTDSTICYRVNPFST
jgi:hypothetical protein